MPIYIGTLKKYGGAQHWRLEFPVENNVNGIPFPSNIPFKCQKYVSFIRITPIGVFVEKQIEKFRAEKLYNILAWNVLCKVLWTGSLRRRWGFTEREHIQKGFPVFEWILFLASQDAQEVMFVSQSVTGWQRLYWCDPGE